MTIIGAYQHNFGLVWRYMQAHGPDCFGPDRFGIDSPATGRACCDTVWDGNKWGVV